MIARSLRSPLVLALLDPGVMPALGAGEWNAVLLLAQENGLLARLAAELATRGLLDGIPAKARAQLYAARITAQSTQTLVRFEIDRVLRALTKSETPIILLKGAAYMMAELPPARGRIIGDLDLMVPRAKIDGIERTLISKGWSASQLDEYDQRYYREWAHEIPPMLHRERATTLDIHHTIAPLTSNVHPDAGALIAAAIPLADERLAVLAPADMVLHSAVHLFNDEVGKPLRDLFDLRDLLTHFGSRDGFWRVLVERAQLHGLQRPLYYTVHYTRRLIGTPIPADIVKAVAAFAPSPPLRWWMDWIFVQRFTPEMPGERRRGAAFARWLYYVRTHWLRMPPLLLARHLSVKAMRRVRERWQRRRHIEE